MSCTFGCTAIIELVCILENSVCFGFGSSHKDPCHGMSCNYVHLNLVVSVFILVYDYCVTISATVNWYVPDLLGFLCLLCYGTFVCL